MCIKTPSRALVTAWCHCCEQCAATLTAAITGGTDEEADIANIDGETLMRNLGYDPPGAEANRHKRKAAHPEAGGSKAQKN